MEPPVFTLLNDTTRELMIDGQNVMAGVIVRYNGRGVPPMPKALPEALVHGNFREGAAVFRCPENLLYTTRESLAPHFIGVLTRGARNWSAFPLSQRLIADMSAVTNAIPAGSGSFSGSRETIYHARQDLVAGTFPCVLPAYAMRGALMVQDVCRSDEEVAKLFPYRSPQEDGLRHCIEDFGQFGVIQAKIGDCPICAGRGVFVRTPEPCRYEIVACGACGAEPVC